MPVFLEKKLKAEYGGKGLSGRRLDAAVYGTLNHIGAMHGNKETAKGARMDAKHESDVAKAERSRRERRGHEHGAVHERGRQ